MDLSRLPEPLRSRLREQLDQLPADVRARLEAQLSKLPAEQIEGVLRKTAPMLERLANKSGGGKAAGGPGAAKPPKRAGTGEASKTGSTTGQAPRTQGVFEPHNHYNNTIQRGDRDSPPLFVIMFVVACVLVYARALGW
jgi:hypothetical protein